MSSGQAVHTVPFVCEMAMLSPRGKEKKHLYSAPATDPPGFDTRSGAGGCPSQVPAGSAPNGLPQFPFCLLHFGLTQQMHTEELCSLAGVRALKQRRLLLFIYLFVCLQCSPSIDGQGFSGLAPGNGTGRNQFSITSEITGHQMIISSKSL